MTVTFAVFEEANCEPMHQRAARRSGPYDEDVGPEIVPYCLLLACSLARE